MSSSSPPPFLRTMNRREVCQWSLAAILAARIGRAAPTAPIASRIIDTHTHFYDPTRPQGVPWPPAGSPLHRRVGPDDWLSLARPHGIRETVVVEASSWLADNDWILALAEKEKCIVGFIGHLQPAEAAFSRELKRLAANPIFRGIRVSGRDLVDRIASPEFLAGVKLLADQGLALEVNGVSDPAIIAGLAERVPALRIVIDHCGNCGDAQKLKQVWKEGMNACARHPQVWCKVSALAEMTDTPPGQAPADPGYYLPVLDHLWSAFGADRLIYGSNWPVSEKGAHYDVIFTIVGAYFAQRGAAACENYFWKNSLQAYQWIERK